MMRAYPSVQQLKCLLAVTELLNFRSAAERLNLSQPPLSRHIKALEGLVGVQLFERDTHSVVPTEAGTILARQTREILRHWTLPSMPRRRRANPRPTGCGSASRGSSIPEHSRISIRC